MVIACLGWGSLIWDPRSLPIRCEWFKDGPFVPVEFSRRSNDGRITLVIDALSVPVRVLWAQMIPNSLSEAVDALADRENIKKNRSSDIGAWKRGDATPQYIPELSAWAEARGVDAVVWTALKPKFDKQEGETPSADKVVEYLRRLMGTERDAAKRYIENAPSQIDTEYRRRIEAALGWNSRT
jgi:hypothetical protein